MDAGDEWTRRAAGGVRWFAYDERQATSAKTAEATHRTYAPTETSRTT